MKNYHACRIFTQFGIASFHRRAWSLAMLAFAAAVSAFFPTMRAVAANQVLSGTVPAVVANLQPIGQLDAGQELNLEIGLPLRNHQGLEELLQQIYDPSSPNFRQYLTPAQFRESFGPAEQDYQAVVAFAKANNLTVTYEHSNRVILDVSGTVADIETAFHVNMLVYQHPMEARTFFAPDAEPSLDLTVPILRIAGLDNYAVPHRNCTATLLGNAGNAVNVAGQPAGLAESDGSTNSALAQPNSLATSLGNAGIAMPNGASGSGPSDTYWGYDFRDAYLPGVTLTGSNQAVGLLEFGGYSASDIIHYETYRTPNLPNVALTNVVFGNDILDTNDVEVTLDIDMAIAMAPGLSQVIVYEAAVSPSGVYWDSMFNLMADDNIAKQLSCSWWLDGPADPVAEEIFEQMAAQGQSMFVASGDNDAFPTGTLVPFPEDSPHVTLVGGTELTTSGPGGSWNGEAVWNWNYAAGCNNAANVGSSGGISTNYAIPVWQMGVNMTSSHGSTTMRNTPDVALTADEVFEYLGGTNLCAGGTSCAAPLWAGFTALVNQQAAANNLPPVGFLNPALYAIGEGSSYSSDFHDTTVGNNIDSISGGQYLAVSGYDLCTGWGTPAGQSLINDLSSSGSCLFSIANNLNTARRFQTAVLLPDGLVLAAGGYGSTYLSSAEIYPNH